MRSAFDSAVFMKVAVAIESTTSLDPTEVSPSTRLVEDLSLGRFGRLRLAIHLEEIFDLELSDEVVQRFVTVSDIAGYFSRRYFRDVRTSRLAHGGLAPPPR